jgi:3-methyladenine DNA glycosylase AlkC
MLPSKSTTSFKNRESIPLEYLEKLNKGEIEARTLVETLSIDFNKLLENIFNQPLSEEVKGGITARMKHAGIILGNHFPQDFVTLFERHPSDTVRGWVAYGIAEQDLPLRILLDTIKPFADDSHSGVREWAWMALRPKLAEDIEEGIALLIPWTTHPSPNIRRFACEITRPRGVWCSHISELKENPQKGLPVLASLNSDPSRYVQNSVGNWLNDAAKHHPTWVKNLCHQWQLNSPTLETRYICKRACRSLLKSST